MIRPELVRIVHDACTGCLLCRELAPELHTGRPVLASAPVLDAMGECPAGAIRWSEGDEPP